MNRIAPHSICSGMILVCMLMLAVPGTAQADNEPEMITEKQFIHDYLDTPEQMERFGRISDRIWFFAELGLQEFRSSELLAKTLEEEGFVAERGLAGMPTCFVATYGSGQPVIGILAEFDALPMISQKPMVAVQDPLVQGAPGHGCGHNVMGSASIAAAIAARHAMEKFGISGTIKVFGSPSEETVISRPYMIRAGLFDGVDVVIDNHLSHKFGTSYGVQGNAIYSARFTFTGRTAHSAGAPWSGRSAMDAVEIMNVATNYLREHLHYTHRLHYVVTQGGEAPNVVPDKAAVWYYVRNTDDRIEDMWNRVVNCAKAAALATDTELSEVRIFTAVHQKHASKALAELMQVNIEQTGMPRWTEKDQAFARELQAALGKDTTGMPLEVDSLKAPSGKFVGGGSTDVGDVSLIAPTATIGFPGAVPGAIFHHWSLVACNHGSLAWKGLNAGARAIGTTAIDLLTDREALAAIRKEFEDYSREHPYKPLLPAESEPPLDLNRELMEKWRGVMESTYE